ncbi:unnamed protein product [Hymenolepis diminuta]|uniref:Integrase catalytic domain-containing protein n=1 Tax=Hymenolepis diminuta TaxID=6216 RepID=A0A564XX16_HYMDI|nr:unnamed protein product [Hymenolepis diminuta]
MEQCQKCLRKIQTRHQGLIYSQIKAPWPHIDLTLLGSIYGISYLILVNLYSKCPKVISIKSATTSGVINSVYQVFANQGVPKVIVSRNITLFSST